MENSRLDFGFSVIQLSEIDVPSDRIPEGVDFAELYVQPLWASVLASF